MARFPANELAGAAQIEWRPAAGDRGTDLGPGSVAADRLLRGEVEQRVGGGDVQRGKAEGRRLDRQPAGPRGVANIDITPKPAQAVRPVRCLAHGRRRLAELVGPGDPGKPEG